MAKKKKVPLKAKMARLRRKNAILSDEKKFLLEDEIQPEKLQLTSGETGKTDASSSKISLKNVSVVSETDGTSILSDVSFEVVPGKLTVIIGPCGSGKSSVLLSILREMAISAKSTIDVSGKLIYASQEAWIFSGTVRENILFGRQYDSLRYREAVKYASLEADFKQFANGDLTDVEDRGTSLSGGQRARISLARALYTDADCYLLDDPLSAVDASVAKALFEKCIKGYLRKKCVILVTHQLQYVKEAEQIVVLKNGATLAVGSYNELLRAGIDLYKYSTIEGSASGLTGGEQGSSLELGPPSPSVASSSVAGALTPFRYRMDSMNSDIYRASRTTSFIDSEHDSVSNYEADFKAQFGLEGSGQDGTGPATEEVGSYSTLDPKKSTLRTLMTYIRAGAGPLLFLTFLVSNFVTQIVFTGTDYWLSAWTDYQEKLHILASNPNYTFTSNPIISPDESTNKLIYSGIILCLFVFAIIRTVSYFTICMRSSVNLHNRIFSSLIEAPIGFFDRTPIGVIMNRVSRDLGIIDDLLPPTGFEAIEILGNCMGIFVLCTALNYFIAIPFVILMVFLLMGTKFYVTTARKVKRLEGVARSPLFNQMASTLGGLTTIRSYGTERLFISRFAQAQNLHTSAFFIFLSCSRIFGVYLEMICFTYIACLIAYMNAQLESYSGSIIGLVLSQSLMLTDSFNWGVRQYTEVENYMTSVERVVEFGKLEKEALESAQEEAPEGWPTKGDIVFENVGLSYRSTSDPSHDDIDPPKYVLRDLSFSIASGEKIGIVGRTGAGKSSLITTLFRLTQPSGCIRIDRLDTGRISLSRLRRSLSIIPQEPVLFSGNIRRNLDPFNEKTDEELWDAVDKVQLKAKILSLPAKLDSPVTECGSDFSVGQKQLVCLARAILRKNRIIVCDEATANVDPRTDALIQQTIRTEFAHCTVLTIAHRLNTIIDYDRVLVLDAGCLAQFDTPFSLIDRGEGIFFELYDSLNQEVKAELRSLAQEAAKKGTF